MRLLALPLLLMLAACAGPGPGTPAPDESAPDFGRPGEPDYHVFMGELALQREKPALAATEFLRAARVSEDTALAERAARFTAAYGTPEEALEAAELWAARSSESLHPQRLLVRANLALGRSGPAAAGLRRLRDAGGDGGRAFIALLPLAGEARDPGVALEAMSAVTADYPADPSAAYVEGYLALSTGQTEAARDAVRRALALEPGWIDAALLYARTLEAAGEAQAALDWLAAHEAAASRELRLERATILINAERADEARTLLEALLDEAPADPEALRALGYLEFHAGRAAEARTALMTLLEHGEYTNDALFYLGGLAEQEGNIEEAARLYSRVDAGEHLVTAQVRLALLMFRMGRPELALQHLELFAQRNPGAAIELGVARAELLSRLGRPEEAVAVYDGLLERLPDEVGLRYARAMLGVELGRVDAAVADFRHIVGLRPDDPVALNALGYTLADLTERHDEAYELISRALALDPENPAVLDSMGWVLFRLGRPVDSLPYLERALTLQNDPEIAAHLGEVLWTLGRKEDARATWLEALVEFPGSRILLDTMGRLDP
ncbi:tetratricopeptide repeat protein [Thioalkalivibrio sp. XN279]|uniref:tetratricopeptide repeat protein n=1 Tax=Thioalkalivibrio sp. XN279 TaxID=2714953 RepID=UPI001409D3DE|nr:tetratricopeptide repeat protein [Thioalkalivibrio sp. XN279]NHA15015.1 tetratricopeptide repeat protein [Thioalkalivibrio sp. XN279]